MLFRSIYESAIHEERERKKVFENYDAHPFEFALYSELEEVLKNRAKSVEATKAIFAKLFLETKIIGWKNKTSSEKKIMEIIYDELANIGFADDKISQYAQKIIEIAKHRL